MPTERYERLRSLSEDGAMSDVWLARDIHTQRLVALKIMRAVSEDDRRNQKAQERFHREIEIASSLQHPHILSILNYGYMDYKEHYVPYLVVPYLRDGSLADLIRSQPPWQSWSLLQTADAVMQAAEGLWYLHTHSPPVVHEDVKPGNFLIRLERSRQRVAYLYLCDFGISRWLQSSFSLASELLGTFAYIAPEQVKRKVHCASDQYALAVMACYLLTGKLPIQAATNEEYAQAHLHDPPRLPSQLHPDRINSSEIDDVIARALAKSPSDRFPSVVHFAEALQQAIMRLYQQRAAAKTERFGPAFAQTIYPSEPILPHMPPIHHELALPIALDPPDTGEEQVLDEPLPAKPQKMRGPLVNDGAKTYALLPLKDPVRCELPSRPRMFYWSHDGRCVAGLLYEHAPLIVCKENKTQEVQIPPTQQPTSLCWSPDNRVLAVCVQNEVHFWDTVTSSALPLILRFNVRAVGALDWSVAGRLAIWVENKIMLYSLPYNLLLTSRSPAPQTLETGMMRCANSRALSWSPDGSLLAAGASNGSLLCWRLSQQTAAWQVAAPGQKVLGTAWSIDSALLLAAFRDSRIVGWNTLTWEQEFVWTKLPSLPRVLSISQNGVITIASSEKRLLFGSSTSSSPSAVFPGQLLAAWSPVSMELATLDEDRETSLVIWHA